MRAATGEQFELSLGRTSAIVTELAATLRSLRIGGVDIVEPFAEESLPPFASGIVLVPWPNRIEDGRWRLNGEVQQLDLTEPDRHNAIHGLLRNQPYRMVHRTESSITLAATVFAQHGYPFQLETSVRYELREDGLRTTHGVRNVSRAPAPYAVGAHPYLTIGDVPAQELTLTVSATSRFETDDRLNPVREVPVEGTEFDLHEGRRAGDLHLDTGFGGVHTVDGASAWLTAPDGRRVSLLQDDEWGYLQVFVNHAFPKAGGQGLAVALEPMTAPAGAFVSGKGVRWVEPGASWEGGWGIRYSG